MSSLPAKLKDPRTCRRFFSSPFGGMEEEREELTRKYFPQIHHQCNSRGIQFVAVDMRWGITSEAAEDAQTVNICLRELDRCNLFVGFYGQAILDIVDPNRYGHVSLQEYMAFMISLETENVQSSSEVEQAFRALTSGEKPYITAQELYANLTKEQADYCVARMKPYVDKTGRTITDTYDYADFTRQLVLPLTS